MGRVGVGTRRGEVGCCSLNDCVGLGDSPDFFHCVRDVGDMHTIVYDQQFRTVLCDPPHDMQEKWYDALFCELSRVSSHRIIFQHWFVPSHQDGSFKGDPDFILSNYLTWFPDAYEGQPQIISVFDK